jgi:hypothetical protein
MVTVLEINNKHLDKVGYICFKHSYAKNLAKKTP